MSAIQLKNKCINKSFFAIFFRHFCKASHKMNWSAEQMMGSLPGHKNILAGRVFFLARHNVKVHVFYVINRISYYFKSCEIRAFAHVRKMYPLSKDIFVPILNKWYWNGGTLECSKQWILNPNPHSTLQHNFVQKRTL